MPKKKGKSSKKNKGKIDVQEEVYKAAPHSFVFHRGHVGRNVKQLVLDTRMVMEPFTAKTLKVRRKNVLKDFVNVAGLLHVTHFIIYTKTDVSVNMKLCRLPRGPTLTFKVHNYSMTRDVTSSLKKPNLEHVQYLHHPLLVMNNFSGEGKHIKLMSTMFQNMFPSINVHKVKLNDVRRCVMVNYNSDTNMIDFRHYNIKVVPVGVSRNVKKLIQAKIPNLSKFGDISEYVDRVGYSSESEAELDGPQNEVILPQPIKSRGNIKSSKSAVRLTELGPRLTLQLVKIEEGICDGAVMFHEFVHKTDEELAAQKALRKKKMKLKEARRKQQQENIAKKDEQSEEHKQKCLAGMKQDDNVENPEISTAASDEEVDDAEYYRREVGVTPDADMFPQHRGKRKKVTHLGSPAKKRKFSAGSKFDHTDKKGKTDGGKWNKSKSVEKHHSKDSRSKGDKKQALTLQEEHNLKKKRKMKLKEKKISKFKKKHR